jgi:hypothetical protein
MKEARRRLKQDFFFSGNGLENFQLVDREDGRVTLIRILSNTLVGLP